MIFGQKFFVMLKKLSPWKQSLFALALAQRQFPNYALWCEVEKVNGGRQAFLKTLNLLWEFHSDKFNNIDLEKVLDELEPYLLDDEKKQEELTLGDLFSLDASISIQAAILAIILHEGEEAKMASLASLGGVIRTVENEKGELDDESMREQEAVDNEVNYQIELLDLISKSERSGELTQKVRDLALNGGISNIGLSVEA